MKIISDSRGTTLVETIIYIVGFILVVVLSNALINSVLGNNNSSSVLSKFNNEKSIVFNLIETHLSDGYKDTITLEQKDAEFRQYGGKEKVNVLRIETLKGDTLVQATLTEGESLVYFEQQFKVDGSGNIIDRDSPVFEQEMDFPLITSMDINRPKELCTEDSTGTSINCIQVVSLLVIILYHDSDLFGKRTTTKGWRVFYEGEEI